MAHSYFEILGIPEEATTDDVKSAYRRLAHLYHPDHCQGDSKRFRAVQEAYDALVDPEQRRRFKELDTGESIPVRVVRNSGSSGASRSSPRGEPLRPTSHRSMGGNNRPVRPREYEFSDFHSEIEELFNRILRSFFF